MWDAVKLTGFWIVAAILAVPAIVGAVVAVVLAVVALGIAAIGIIPVLIWLILADARYWKNLATRGVEHRN